LIPRDLPSGGANDDLRVPLCSLTACKVLALAPAPQAHILPKLRIWDAIIPVLPVQGLLSDHNRGPLQPRSWAVSANKRWTVRVRLTVRCTEWLKSACPAGNKQVQRLSAGHVNWPAVLAMKLLPKAFRTARMSYMTCAATPICSHIIAFALLASIRIPRCFMVGCNRVKLLIIASGVPVASNWSKSGCRLRLLSIFPNLYPEASSCKRSRWLRWHSKLCTELSGINHHIPQNITSPRRADMHLFHGRHLHSNIVTQPFPEYLRHVPHLAAVCVRVRDVALYNCTSSCRQRKHW